MEQHTKFCPRCECVKPWSEFHVDRRRQRPGPYCKPCLQAYNKARYVSRSPIHAAECRQCSGPIETPLRSTRPKLFCSKRCRETWHNWKDGAPENRRDSWLRTKYGISLAMYSELLERQRGCCLLCTATEAESRNGVLDVDHDHATGAVRGLLCHRCNWALGIIADDPNWLRRAAKYLEANASD